MKIRFINVLALSLCLGSLACTQPKADERSGEQEQDHAYAAASLDAHRTIRSMLREMITNMHDYKDTASYVQSLFPKMMYIDSTLAQLPMDGMHSAADTLMYTASARLFNSYHELMNEEFRLLFSRYHQIDGEPEGMDKMYIDSLWGAADHRDRWALENYARFLPKDGGIVFDLEPLIP